MGCHAIASESDFDIHFNLNKHNQKNILEFFLIHSEYDLKDLSELLEVTPFLLNLVLNGKEYLPESKALQMLEWLLVLIG